MGKALIVYASRTGNTRAIADLIAEGVRFSGHEAVVKEVKEIANAEALAGYDAYAFGAPTYHGEMIQGMKTFLFLAEQAGLAGKPGGAFGAFGWSGEGFQRIYDTMKNVFAMDMAADALRLKNADLGGGVQMAQGYGKDLGKKMG